MKQNKLTVIIDRPIEEVFEFTTNPGRTPLWISSIMKEMSSKNPPTQHTVYANRGNSNQWDVYDVVEIEPNKSFTLRSLDRNYFCKYSLTEHEGIGTELVYSEWVRSGELPNPFPVAHLDRLKEIMEQEESVTKFKKKFLD